MSDVQNDTESVLGEIKQLAKWFSWVADAESVLLLFLED